MWERAQFDGRKQLDQGRPEANFVLRCLSWRHVCSCADGGRRVAAVDGSHDPPIIWTRLMSVSPSDQPISEVTVGT